jgi:alpha-N-arabinofuranosidase
VTKTFFSSRNPFGIILSILIGFSMKGQASSMPAPSRPALYLYTRSTDASTTITVDASQPNAIPISQDIFGNFLEDLGHAIERGILADAILNPSLEPENPSDTAPPFWTLQGNATWVEGGYYSPHAVQLAGATNGLAVGRLEQTVFLPVTRDPHYRFEALCRSLGTAGTIELLIEGTDAREGQVFAQRPIVVHGRTWQKVTFTFSVQEATPQKGEAYRFVLAYTNGDPVIVDRISLMPTDNIAGLDPEVVARAREWHIPILRYPGGNFSSGYHWEDGIGDPNRRPSSRNPAWGGIQSNRFGTDEFLHFCHLLHIQPQITVNAGDGTPENAAAWVAYCNGAPDSSVYAQMRAENGHPAPYGVKIWEVGNELYGDWQIGHTDAQGNAQRFVKFRDAMLRVDPTIKLIATGKGDEFTPEGLSRDAAWNEALLRRSLEEGNRPPDYLSIHPLLPLPEAAGAPDYDAQYQSAMAFPTFLDRVMFPQLAHLIQQGEGPYPHTRLAVTEWGIIVGGPNWRSVPNHSTFSGAIFNALMLNAMMRHSDLISIANMTGFMHGGCIEKVRGVVYVDPQYYTQQLYAVAKPYYPVAIHIEGPGEDVPARGRLQAVTDVPDVDAFAALTKDRNTLTLFLINHLIEGDRLVRLTLNDFEARSVSATILTADSPMAANDWAHPDRIKPQPYMLPTGFLKEDSSLNLPAHTLLVLTLHR